MAVTPPLPLPDEPPILVEPPTLVEPPVASAPPEALSPAPPEVLAPPLPVAPPLAAAAPPLPPPPPDAFVEDEHPAHPAAARTISRSALIVPSRLFMFVAYSSKHVGHRINPAAGRDQGQGWFWALALRQRTSRKRRIPVARREQTGLAIWGVLPRRLARSACICRERPRLRSSANCLPAVHREHR